MIVPPTPRSELIRQTIRSFLFPLGWIAISLSLLPLRRFVEPGVALLLELILSRRRYYDRYEYAPEHFLWAVVFFVAVGMGFLLLSAWGSTGAVAYDRRFTRYLQDRVDEGEVRNTRALDDL